MVSNPMCLCTYLPKAALGAVSAPTVQQQPVCVPAHSCVERCVWYDLSALCGVMALFDQRNLRYGAQSDQHRAKLGLPNDGGSL